MNTTHLAFSFWKTLPNQLYSYFPKASCLKLTLPNRFYFENLLEINRWVTLGDNRLVLERERERERDFWIYLKYKTIKRRSQSEKDIYQHIQVDSTQKQINKINDLDGGANYVVGVVVLEYLVPSLILFQWEMDMHNNTSTATFIFYILFTN